MLTARLAAIVFRYDLNCYFLFNEVMLLLFGNLTESATIVKSYIL